MSTPGWYPDPGGRPGHYRFWDGRGWSSTTSTEVPGRPAPTGPSGTPPPRRRTGLWILVAAATVVVLVVVGALVLVPGGTPGAAGTPTTSEPAPTTAPASTEDPEVTATPTDAPSRPAAQPSSSCPVGDPLARQDHPADGRVHGGGLSFPEQEGWQVPGEQMDAFTWAYDVGETDHRGDQGGTAAYAVGAVSVADGFESPRQAARLMLQCTLERRLFPEVGGTPAVIERRTTVDDVPATTLVAQIPGNSGDPAVDGNVLVITVVDLGSGESLSFFWGSAPRADPSLTTRLEVLNGQLAVD